MKVVISMQVFISYSREDKELGEEVETRIKDKAFYTWRDTTNLHIGDEWILVIDKAIRDCTVLVIIITPESMASHYVTYEWSFALGLGKVVLPLIFRKPEKMHPRINHLQCLQFHEEIDFWGILIARLRHIENSNVVPEEVLEASKALRRPTQSDWDSAIEILQKNSHKSAADELFKAADSELHIYVRTGCALAFAERTQYQDNRITKALQRIIQKDREDTRLIKKIYQVADALGRIDTDDAIQTLIEVFEESQNHLLSQHIISQSLGEARNSNLKPFFRRVIENNNMPRYRYTALFLLGKFKEDEDIPLFKKILLDELGRGNENELHAVMNNLTMMASDSALDALIESLRPWLRANSLNPVTEKLVYQIVHNIAYMENPRAIEKLRQLLSGQSLSRVTQYIQHVLHVKQNSSPSHPER
jgi:HEAT repeat protein